MVVAQLAERSLPTPEIRCSNPDIGNISFLSDPLKSLIAILIGEQQLLLKLRYDTGEV